MLPLFSNISRIIKIIIANVYVKCLGRSVAVKSRTFVAIGLEEQFPLGWVAGAM